jgi:hypothetical protein
MASVEPGSAEERDNLGSTQEYREKQYIRVVASAVMNGLDRGLDLDRMRSVFESAANLAQKWADAEASKPDE